MRGTNAKTGKALDGLAHLSQSVRDILLTPLGSRVMRRDYGSRLMELTDAPMNRATVMDLYASVTDSLNKWEPRFKLDKIAATNFQPGIIQLSLTGFYEGQAVTLVVAPDPVPYPRETEKVPVIERVSRAKARVVGQPPVLTSPSVIDVSSGHFEYQIAASGNPHRFYVTTGLPSGLTLNAQTGLISGSVYLDASHYLTVGAQNEYGTDEMLVLLSFLPPPGELWTITDYMIGGTDFIVRPTNRVFANLEIL